MPDKQDDALAPDGVWLVSDDGEGTGIALAQALTARGVRVALLRFPTPVLPERLPLPEGARAVVLEDLSEAHLETQLATVGPVAGFVHVEPGSSENHFFPASTKARLKHIFLIAKHLKSALDAAAQNGR